jgi:2-keto-4-pentenoate hydratase/2-oxohepta-3-ene-1,7-dioic acid hydratase in catechol pathway
MVLRLLALALALLVACAAAATGGVFDPKAAAAAPPGDVPRATLAIAPREEALTFARVVTAGGPATIAVRAYESGVIRGQRIDSLFATGEDAADFVLRVGYDAAQSVIESISAEVGADASAALVPIDLGAAHIAAGVNYRAHAEEATVDGGPFLFPKFAAPTRARAPIPSGEGLLDYEVELCLVALAPIAPGQRASGGLVACNDVTDRARLLRGLDPAAPESGAGFPDGKSGEGYLPVGDLFVVPKDLSAFVATLDLSLTVNGETGQQTPAALWIWDFDRILEEARARRDARWTFNGEPAALPFDADGAVPARTLILGGTPGGTVFKGLLPSAYARGVLRWIGGGFQGPVSRLVIEAHIAEARRRGEYLRRGDLVVIEIDRLGALANRVE